MSYSIEKRIEEYFVEVFRFDSDQSVFHSLESVTIDYDNCYTFVESRYSRGSAMAARKAVASYLENGYGTKFKVRSELTRANGMPYSSSFNIDQIEFFWNIELNVQFSLCNEIK
jgi:hypothetical protein